MTDEALMGRLFVNGGVRLGARFHAEPDWTVLVRELKRPGVNLTILWDPRSNNHISGPRRKHQNVIPVSLGAL